MPSIGKGAPPIEALPLLVPYYTAAQSSSPGAHSTARLPSFSSRTTIGVPDLIWATAGRGPPGSQRRVRRQRAIL
jgi:hypothetical protein